MNESSDTSTLEYAERRSRAAFWTDLSLGVCGVTIVIPVAGYIAWFAIGTTDVELIGRLFCGALAIAGFACGAWCVRLAIRAWCRRNIIESEEPLRVQSLRWRWVAPAGMIAICIAYVMDSSTKPLKRVLWAAIAIPWLLMFIKGMSLHASVRKAERRA